MPKTEKRNKRIYLAGGLFNAAERVHNLNLEKALLKLGYEVILPQREATKFFNGEGFDLKGIVKDCRDSCVNPDNVYVGSSDGPDADSGACVEYGFALVSTGRAVVYRTDFRTALDREVGVNAMLGSEGTSFVYDPCFITDLDQVEAYYDGLAHKIHETISLMILSVRPILAKR
jgi:nucleoside 2-deoxyribosyltransferase